MVGRVVRRFDHLGIIKTGLQNGNYWVVVQDEMGKRIVKMVQIIK
jgi:hypothetical protein